jgi:hypothetical protein
MEHANDAIGQSCSDEGRRAGYAAVCAGAWNQESFEHC